MATSITRYHSFASHILRIGRKTRHSPLLFCCETIRRVPNVLGLLTIAVFLGCAPSILLPGCTSSTAWRREQWYSAGYIITTGDDGTLVSVTVSLDGRDPAEVSFAFPEDVNHLSVLNLGDMSASSPYAVTVLSQTPRSLRALLVRGDLTDTGRNVIEQRLQLLAVVSFHDATIDWRIIAMLQRLPNLETVDFRNASYAQDIDGSALARLRERVDVDEPRAAALRTGEGSGWH